MGETYSDKKQLFRVTKTRKNRSTYSWLNNPIVKIGSATMAVQTYVYSKFSNEYDVKVELVEVISKGEVDMEQYMNRKQGLSAFVKPE